MMVGPRVVMDGDDGDDGDGEGEREERRRRDGWWAGWVWVFIFRGPGLSLARFLVASSGLGLMLEFGPRRRETCGGASAVRRPHHATKVSRCGSPSLIVVLRQARARWPRWRREGRPSVTLACLGRSLVLKRLTFLVSVFA